MARNQTDPPKLGPLADYVEAFPCPFVARANVFTFTGGLIKPKTIINDEAAGKGPRKSLTIGKKRVYPVPYLLEYLEAKGVTEINVDPIIQA